ncbi:hypothetical protein PGS50_20040 [Yersinia intermedia]|nr:hypothetical protein [Yersinia intermedia]MDA5495527.1 hypothetical protein [Yersinia intermedia]
MSVKKEGCTITSDGLAEAKNGLSKSGLMSAPCFSEKKVLFYVLN